MTTTHILANRVRTVLGWIDDNAAILPGDWGLHVSGLNVAVHWHDREAGDYTRSLLERQFGTGTDREYDGQTETSWSAEGDRPELTVFYTTVRAGAVA